MTDKIRVLVVDDEPLAREGILVLLEPEEDVEVVGECGDGTEAAEAIRSLAPDLVFLDIEMPGMNGLAVLEGIPHDEMPVVIFVTAYDEYAIQAFEVHALDYLLKPYDDERFARSLERARTELRYRGDSRFTERLAAMLAGRVGPGETPAPLTTEPSEDGDEHLKRLVIKRSGRVFFLDVDEIDWIEAADYYVRLHVGEESHLLRITMKEMEASLDPEKFFRIHRSSIVNMERVRELQPFFHGEYVVIMQDGTKLSLSRSRRKQLEERLGQRL